ncbi:ABC transporter permease [Methanosarcina horonobensis]|uniref:ABC transporter permease n=1 Tax=Methanosarcina horonobensis TaxID=418008 RepID=UPI000AD6FBF7|nr:ABC transporter permease [Methanosarcina horonobensis]
MKLAKILKIALNMVKANKLRSWLTIIGVIIGIASVMAIVTTGEYFQEQVTETLEGWEVIPLRLWHQLLLKYHMKKMWSMKIREKAQRLGSNHRIRRRI